MLGERIYSDDGADLETVVGRLLRERGETLSVAESMTGGLVGERITSVAGSSDYFLGGLLTYTDKMKEALLGVPPAMLAEHTAVSEPVAIAMAQGARERTGSTWALAVTGYAGPDGEEVGNVFLGLASPEVALARRYVFGAERNRIRRLAATYALDWLRRRLQGVS